MGEHSNRNRHGQKSKPRGPLGRQAGDRWDWRGLPQDIAEECWTCIQVGVRGGFFQEQTGCEGAEAAARRADHRETKAVVAHERSREGTERVSSKAQQAITCAELRRQHWQRWSSDPTIRQHRHSLRRRAESW